MNLHFSNIGKSKDVTEQQKSAILALVEVGRHKMEDIAQQVGVSKRTVQHIKKIGAIRNASLGKCGRQWATTVNTDRLIKSLIFLSPNFPKSSRIWSTRSLLQDYYSQAIGERRYQYQTCS